MAGLWVIVPSQIGNNRGGAMEVAGVDLGNGYAALATAEASVAAGTAALTTVASSATDVVILAANAARKSASIFNDSAANLFVRYGTTAATLVAYSAKVAAGGTLQVPTGYSGAIHGIWDSADGNARVTEFTA